MAKTSATGNTPARNRTRKARADNGTLFGEMRNIERPVSVTDSMYLYTNNFNVLEILACGYAKPRYAFAKYYQDLFALSKGWIPLVAGAVGADVVNTLCAEPPSYPVALRLRSSASSGASHSSIIAGDTCVIALQGSVPRTEFDALVFASASDREQFTLREYEGIDLSDKRLEVDPALFSRNDVGRILEALKDLPPSEIPGPERYLVTNRVAGGVATLLAFEFARKLPSSVVAVTRFSGNLDLCATLRLPAANPFAFVNRDSATVDERLFAASLAVLQHVDRFTSWDPLGIVDRIESLYLSQTASGNAPNLAPVFKYIKRVLALETDFVPFKPDTGYIAAKALLLALLRPDLEELLSWQRAETGSDDYIDRVAAFLGGFATGFDLVPLSQRPLQINNLLAWWQSLLINHEISNAIPAPDQYPGDLLVASALVEEVNQKVKATRQTDRSSSEVVQWTTISGESAGMQLEISAGRFVLKVRGEIAVTKGELRSDPPRTHEIGVAQAEKAKRVRTKSGAKARHD